jgi:hypothetical protein
MVSLCGTEGEVLDETTEEARDECACFFFMSGYDFGRVYEGEVKKTDLSPITNYRSPHPFQL